MIPIFLWMVFPLPGNMAASLADLEGGCTSKEGLPCILPFRYQGKLYFECFTDSPGFETQIFGRCPIRLLNETSLEASAQGEDWRQCGQGCPLQEYTSNTRLEKRLTRLAAENPDLVRLFSLGKSSGGQNMAGVQISNGAQKPRQLLKPKVRYVGNMHGNEPVGRELLLHLAEFLVASYPLDKGITQLLDRTDITIIPTINPDGFDRATEGKCVGEDYKAGRYNEGNRDLNRDFPTWKELDANLTNLEKGRQPETKAMMDLIKSEPWVLSANFHGGAVVASYPWDDYRQPGVKEGIAKTPDHDVFYHLARVYATNHLNMLDQSTCTRWYFEDGTTNGAAWYALNGGMQDYNYLTSNDLEITLEVSCCKYPHRYYLNKHWDENRSSLLKYIQEVHRGVKGFVRDARGRPVPNAAVMVLNPDGQPRGKMMMSSSHGEYWRILLPGTYKVRAEKDDCNTKRQRLVSPWQQVNITEASPEVRADLLLTSEESCQGAEDPLPKEGIMGPK